MLNLSKYDVYIFDCDGVILDSNQLKIEAMRNAVAHHFDDKAMVDECVDYFSQNFGKSRFHHVDEFVTRILPVAPEQSEQLKQAILEGYSAQCKELYLSADVTPGFFELLKQLDGKKFVASGSEQQELRDVFAKRDLYQYFDEVYGSPTAKATLIENILSQTESANAIMFGDAVSDLTSAQQNNIDFVFYAPFSNVLDKMTALCEEHNLPIISNYQDVI